LSESTPKQINFETLRANSDGIHVRIYQNEYCYVKVTSQYHKRNNENKWIVFEPSPKIKAIIDRMYGDHWEKVNRANKLKAASEFYDQFPNYQNNRKMGLSMSGNRSRFNSRRK